MGAVLNKQLERHLIMMLFACLMGLTGLVGSVVGNCQLSADKPKSSAIDDNNYRDACAVALMEQVHREFNASFTYLQMAAQFSEDDYYLPGVAKMFWEHADEEREHAKQFISYLRMRGFQDDTSFFDKMQMLGPESSADRHWSSVTEALEDALKLEKSVSGSIKQIIDECSKADNNGPDDQYTVDWLVGVSLEEQMKGQRHLAGLINSLSMMKMTSGSLGEWLFDQELSA